jgi:hypothetical protein
MNLMNTFTRTALVSICLLASAAHALPIEQIQRQGEYLKSLITQVNLEQFKKDAAVFFEFDPQFPLSGQQMLEYKKIAKALLDHANATRAEKFEERKLLLGKTIHNWRALAKASALGATTGFTGLVSLYVFLEGFLQHRQLSMFGLSLLGFGLTGLCAYGARYYGKHALNSIDPINRQMQDLLSIIEVAKQLNAQMNGSEENRA